MEETTRKAGEFFEGYAGQFDEIYMIQRQKGFKGWLNRQLRASILLRYEKTFLSLQPMAKHTVLDIGCGSGRYMLKCLELDAAKVTGIDLSEEMLALSRKALEQAGDFSIQAELVCQDFLERKFQAPYDYAIVMGVMDYVENPKEFLQKLSDVFTKKAVLSFPVAESLWTWQRVVRYKLRRCPLYFYEKSKLEDLVKSVGFRYYSIERIKRDYFVVLQK